MHFTWTTMNLAALDDDGPTVRDEPLTMSVHEAPTQILGAPRNRPKTRKRSSSSSPTPAKPIVGHTLQGYPVRLQSVSRFASGSLEIPPLPQLPGTPVPRARTTQNMRTPISVVMLVALALGSVALGLVAAIIAYSY